MARVKATACGLRARLRDCSLRTAFALYSAIALVAAVVLSVLSTAAIGALAETTLPEDPYAHSGTFVFDEETDSLVPAEKLSWYENPVLSALSEGAETAESALSGSPVLLYVESGTGGGDAPISLASPPDDVRDGTILDTSWTASVSDVYEDALFLSEIAAYDAATSASRPGAEAADALSEMLPENADGERPIVSNVGYYIPYSGDTALYRTMAGLAIASVPAIFVACLVVAGRLFYKNRIAPPVAGMDAAAAKIAEGDLDFEMPPQRDDELGRLCARFEDMRVELARSKAEMWRAAEGRRRVNAAFAHDLRTPLTVVRGRAELIEMEAADEKTRQAAAVIRRQTERLASFADSMSGLESLEDASLRKKTVALAELFSRMGESAEAAARNRGIEVSLSGSGLGVDVEADDAFILRVADNLVSNAARHATTSIAVSLDWSSGMLSLSVRDDGPGFGAAADKALEPFWRGADERSESAGGSDGHMGLGLYVCSVLCAKHGGTMAVSDASEGGGLAIATFSAKTAE